MTMQSTLEMLRAHGIPTNRVLAWTPCYFPFTMGGPVWRPGGAWLNCDDPIWHPSGHAIALCHGPDGMTLVVEFTTGAVVGETLEEVTKDLNEGDPALMDRQVAKARDDRKQATVMEADEFWKRMANARKRSV